MAGHSARPHLIRGLYAITPPSIADDETLLDMCKAALSGGINILQYRDKTAPPERQQQRAMMLAELCQQAAVPLIINDNARLALAVKAAGVHLGKDDESPASVIKMAQKQFIIGVSCYNSPESTITAAAAGATYCALGAMFISSTKPAAKICPLTAIAEAKAGSGLPIVAIGGITADNAGMVFAAGADAVAVCGGVFNTPNIAQTARRIIAAQA